MSSEPPESNAINSVNAYSADALSNSQINPIKPREHSTRLDPEELSSYDSIDWKRLPNFQLPTNTLTRNPSWIWAYSYRVLHRKSRDIYWVCRYCHTHRIPRGLYKIRATTAAIKYLGINKASYKMLKDSLNKPKKRK